MMFSNAITRLPGENFADGLTTVSLGMPEFQRTLHQHSLYLSALRKCGLSLTVLTADPQFPDGTFVEDTAILLPEKRGAILTNPGASSRLGEVDVIRQTLQPYYPDLAGIIAPGTLDGGDICEAGTHYFIGLSQRTNQSGAGQLAAWLSARGFTSSLIDIRAAPGILHLKSGISYIGENRLVVIDALKDHPEFANFELLCVTSGEEYAANCIRVNDHILIASGYPKFEAALRSLGYSLLVLDMSEFQKMDGGLSCLSLRF